MAGGTECGECPELPAEMWCEVLRHALPEDHGVSLIGASRALCELGRRLWRTARRERMAKIAARLVQDLRSLQAFDALMFDRDGLPSRLSAGGTLCDTRSPRVHSMEEWLATDAAYGAVLCREEEQVCASVTAEGDTFRCVHYIPVMADTVLSVSFGRAVRDVRLLVGSTEAPLHPGRVEAGHAVRLSTLPHIGLPVLWRCYNALAIMTTADEDGPVCATFRLCCLQSETRRPLRKGVARSTTPLPHGAKLYYERGVAYIV